MKVENIEGQGVLGTRVDLGTAQLIVIADAWESIASKAVKEAARRQERNDSDQRKEGYLGTVSINVEEILNFNVFIKKITRDTKGLMETQKDLFDIKPEVVSDTMDN